jgi:hypothetical protein
MISPIDQIMTYMNKCIDQVMWIFHKKKIVYIGFDALKEYQFENRIKITLVKLN